MASQIVSWDRSVRNGDPHVLYDLFDIVNPHNAVPLGETVNPSVTTMDLKCTGGEHYLGIDYHHASSVNQGMTNNILVALRNLNTIISLDRQGTGVQWILSSSWDSDFTFASEGDKFYNPHDVWQFSHNTITFIDDGNNRPDCTWDDDAMEGCYSRAVELALDFETMQATVVWQFEYYPTLACGRPTVTCAWPKAPAPNATRHPHPTQVPEPRVGAGRRARRGGGGRLQPRRRLDQRHPVRRLDVRARQHARLLLGAHGLGQDDRRRPARVQGAQHRVRGQRPRPRHLARQVADRSLLRLRRPVRGARRRAFTDP